VTDDQPPVVNGNTVVEAASLITSVALLVSTSTATIMARLDALERGEMKRWQLHDDELERNRAAITAKFLNVEERLDAHMVIANQHFAREHDDDVRMDARVRPVRIGFAWLGSNYKNVLISLFAILGFLLGFLAIAADLASRYLGGST